MNRIFRLEIYKIVGKIKEYFGEEIDALGELGEQELGMNGEDIKSLLITFLIGELQQGKIIIKKEG